MDINKELAVFHQIKEQHDIQQLAELASEIWVEHYTPIIGEEQVKYMLATFHSATRIKQQIATEDYSYYFIESEGKYTGYLGVQRQEEQLFLSKIYVHSQHRGQGLAKKAMNFTKQLAKDFKLQRISLTVNRHNHDSIAAYKKMGFVKVAEQCTDIGQGYVMDDWVMALTL